MLDWLRPPAALSDLTTLIRQVRRRWRIKQALRGVAIVLPVWILTLLLSAYALELLRFSPTAIAVGRLVAAAVLAILLYGVLTRRLLKRVTDEQVALYLEEREPSLEAALVSAVDATGTRLGPAPLPVSPALVRRLVESALERCQAVEYGRRVELGSLRRASSVLAGALACALALVVLGPGYLRQGIAALLFVTRSVEAASPYRIEVTPGSATLPRGADQAITARLVGFESEQVDLMVRKMAGAAFERLPMIAESGRGRYEGVLFDLAGPVDYLVQAAGVRSRLFTLSVVDLPYVQRLELEYHFPAYTGLSAQKVENGGDIAVLRGTEVRLRAYPTMATPGGRLVLHDTQSIPLAREDEGGTLEARFTVDRDGSYRIELETRDGQRLAASPQYAIDALADQPPSVSFAKPGRDVSVAPLDEVFVEARADDDFGVSQLELAYSVNGGSERTVRLFAQRGQSSREVTAGHTFYLEALGVEPGDAVAYHARAADNDGVQGPKPATSDLYFLRIRPFRKDFRPAPSQAGAGMGAGAGDAAVGALSEQQRQIIAATFNVVRDRGQQSPEKFRENVVVLALSQARLREQVEGLVARMNSRLVEPDPSFNTIAELLPKAAEEMRGAEAKLQARRPDQALQPEQRALQYLQKAEEEYELQVTMGRNAGGAAGGPGSIAEDLADLFELELDRLANQYEMAQRAEQQSADQQIDALLEKLKELARRQEQEAERQRRRASAGQGGQTAQGAGQRGLAEQVEEAARRLERLSREAANPALMDTARRLQEAADAMRRAAASGDARGVAEAGVALERLRDAQQRLERGRSARAERDIQDALRRAEELARKQGEIAGDVQALTERGGGAASREQVQRLAGRLAEKKDALESEVADLERRLDGTAAEIRRDEREAARKLQEAAEGIRGDKIKEKIHYSKGVIQSGPSEFLQTLEEEIGANLDALRRKVGEAAGALDRPSDADARSNAVEKAREIARGLESLEERLRQRTDDGRRQSARDRGDADAGAQASEGGGREGGEQAGGAGAQGGGRSDGRAGPGDAFGPWGPGGGYGDRRPWAWTGDAIRQWRGEVRQWSSEVLELRRQLADLGQDVADLDEILKALRALDAERVYRDAAELERLQTFVAEGFKHFEFSLRRGLDASAEQPFLAGSDEVPPGFRRLVEEYYRSLARRLSVQ